MIIFSKSAPLPGYSDMLKTKHTPEKQRSLKTSQAGNQGSIKYTDILKTTCKDLCKNSQVKASETRLENNVIKCSLGAGCDKGNANLPNNWFYNNENGETNLESIFTFRIIILLFVLSMLVSVLFLKFKFVVLYLVEFLKINIYP